MRLSTSTNLYFERTGSKDVTIPESILQCAGAGYRVMDMNFYDCIQHVTPFTTPEWEPWIQEIRQTADRNGVVFSQGHAPFYNFCDSTIKEREYLDQMIRRSVDCAQILEIPWLVIHAGTDFASGRPVFDSRRKNVEYFKYLLEYAAERNVGIAVENLWDYSMAPLRRYTANAEELTDLVEKLSETHDNAGICWDFEHGDIMKQDQKAALLMIGTRLKATHVSDHCGLGNEHIIPFSGRTDWKNVLPVLKQISYEGDLTYEMHRYACGIPEELIPAALKYSVEVGRYLLELCGAKDEMILMEE